MHTFHRTGYWMIIIISTLAILIAGVYTRMVTQPIGNISRPPDYTPASLVIRTRFAITVTGSPVSPSQNAPKLIPIRIVNGQPQITLGLTDSHTAIVPIGTEIFADLGDLPSRNGVQIAV